MAGECLRVLNMAQRVLLITHCFAPMNGGSKPLFEQVSKRAIRTQIG